MYLSILCSRRSRSFELAARASLRIWRAHLSHGASAMILRFTSLIASSSATCLFTRLETSSPFAAALVMLRSISSWRSAQQLGGELLLLLLGRLCKRLDRLLHRTSRSLEQPADRSSWRERAARVSISVFWGARDRSRAPSALRTFRASARVVTLAA